MKKIIEYACGFSAAVALFGIMALTFLDVSGRKLLSNSIPGSLEMTELLMVTVIFAALPLVSLGGEHIVFDSIDSLLGDKVLKVQKAIVHVLCGAAMLGLAWLMWRTGREFGAAGETTAQLGLPKYPFIYGMSVLCGLTGAVHLANAVSPERRAAQTDGAAS